MADSDPSSAGTERKACGSANISFRTGEWLARSPLYTRNSTSPQSRIMVPSSNQNSVSLIKIGTMNAAPQRPRWSSPVAPRLVLRLNGLVFSLRARKHFALDTKY